VRYRHDLPSHDCYSILISLFSCFSSLDKGKLFVYGRRKLGKLMLILALLVSDFGVLTAADG